MDERPEAGTRVKCISIAQSPEINVSLVNIGEEYTVDAPQTRSFLGSHQMTLVEINAKVHDRRPIFHVYDFQLVGEEDDVNDAYDRAMSIL